MLIDNYIYYFGYDDTETELSALETKYLFNKQEKNKVLLSDIKIDPSVSAFIKRRIDIISLSKDYSTLISNIKKECISIEGFKVEYIVLEGDTTEYASRLDKLRDIGFSIEGTPDYYNPTIMFVLCYYDDIWYFGTSIKNNLDWYKHKQKPYSYSNSISISIAKALVNIASQGNKKNKLIDACCGVGTVMLEACFSGYKIDGSDINPKLCIDARANLSYFGYVADVYTTDIKNVNKTYDAAIIDLPYNLLSIVTENDILHIIKSTTEITDRLVIVSTADITDTIHRSSLTITDHCSIRKKGKKSFARRIWVCVPE